jgi:hypothetical protein
MPTCEPTTTAAPTRLGVRRTPCRQATPRLVRAGRVHVLPQRGTRARLLKPARHIDLARRIARRHPDHFEDDPDADRHL